MTHATPIPLCTRVVTIFAADGSLDLEATGAQFDRLAKAGVGLWIGSGGSGEGFALSEAELAKVYRLGAEVAGGRVLVGSNQPETHTPSDSIRHAKIAVDAGVEIVSLYGPAAWHGYRPTDREFLHYMDVVIGALDGVEVAVSPNGSLGYAPAPKLLAAVVAAHPSVSTLNLTGIDGDGYLLDLTAALDREVVIYHGYSGSANALALGATGLHDVSAEGNIIPATFRAYADAISAGDTETAAINYRHLRNLAAFATPWKSAGPRWLKLAIRVLGLPGAGGALREPYLMPDEADQARFRAGAAALGIPEIDELLAS
jgi:4-hydroxy-tetrahydrodipicolinate synthase